MSRVLDLLNPAHGQCRLVFVSATSISLQPHNGRNLHINGLPAQIPTAGVTASNASLAANTTYYVYAWMNGANMALELSTTARATHTNGVEIKTGDATRTLVGMVRTNASSQFVDSYTARLVISWFNRRDVYGATATVTGNVTNTVTLTEVTTSGRIDFLTWSDEGIEVQVVGAVSNSSSGNSVHTTSPGVDGPGGAQTVSTTYAASVAVPALARLVFNYAEGYHYASTYGRVSQGTGSWNFGTQLKIRA